MFYGFLQVQCTKTDAKDVILVADMIINKDYNCSPPSELYQQLVYL